MAPLSDAFYDSPSKKLAVIGVTGTEGKSSTVAFIWQLLRLAGKKAGFISTVQYSLGGPALANPQHQTTPEAPIVQHHLHAMLENGCEYAVVEASSHGLSRKLNRLGTVLFDCGIFMNVTLEHLEFHKTFEQYRSDKANLFRALDMHDHIKLIGGRPVRIPSAGVVNLEDPSAVYFMGCTKKPVYGFTTEGQAGKARPKQAKSETAAPVRRIGYDCINIPLHVSVLMYIDNTGPRQFPPARRTPCRAEQALFIYRHPCQARLTILSSGGYDRRKQYQRNIVRKNCDAATGLLR